MRSKETSTRAEWLKWFDVIWLWSGRDDELAAGGGEGVVIRFIVGGEGVVTRLVVVVRHTRRV